MKSKLFVLLVALMTMGTTMAQQATIHLFYPYDAKTMTVMFGVFAMAAQQNAPHNYIEVNGNYVGSMDAQSYFKLLVAPGNVIINVYTSQLSYEDAKKDQPNSTFALSASPDMEYYVKLSKKGCSFAQKKAFDKALSSSSITYQGKYENGVFYNANGSANQALAVNSNSTAGVGNADHNSNKKTVIQSDVDTNIPQSKKSADDTYALIIANEDYEFVDPVNFASHDGEVFKEYCIKTLGIPEKQVRYCANATYGVISGGVDWLKYALDNFEGSKAIVYYCGHGIPDEKTGDAYIVPVDGKGTNTATCYSLNKLYTTLAATKATNVTYFMDACFTGANKEGSMLVAARGVAREAKKEQLDGNAVVFSASSADETAMTYPEKGHGLFTYFLLKKLQETEGNVSYEELAGYINRNVKKEAFLINEKPQTPVVATSPAASSTWKSMKL